LTGAFWLISKIRCWRPTNDLGVRRRLSLGGRGGGQRRNRVGFAIAQGSSASMSASVTTCGSFSKMWRKYA
jgi:hypothetical protein